MHKSLRLILIHMKPLEEPGPRFHSGVASTVTATNTEIIQLISFFSFLFSSEVFCDSEKNILKENDIVRFPKLADTYQRIAEEGPDVFYNGSMARSIVKDIQAAGLVLFSFFKDPRIKTLRKKS